MALLGPACEGPAPECAQTRMHWCSLGFASGGVSIEGSWANTAVALGGCSALFYSPTRPWYLDAITSGLCFPPVPVPCYDAHRNRLHGDSPTCGPGMSCCCTGHIPRGPTLSTCWALPRPDPILTTFSPTCFARTCHILPHTTTHTVLALDLGLLLL